MNTKRILVKSRKRERVIKQCCVCGTAFSVQPSKVNRIQSCHECRKINRKPPITLLCEYCNSEFTVKGHLEGVQKYCSQECKWNAQSHHPESNWRYLDSRHCLECGSLFNPTKTRTIYCSVACWNNSRRRAAITCAECGLEFSAKRRGSKSGKYFCSRLCRGKHIEGENHPLWVEDRPRDDRGAGWDNLAESIRQRDDYRCQRCGILQADRAHDVHHIEPYRIAQNNHPDNLITLCNSCHKIVEHSPWLLRQSVHDLKP